MPQQPKTNKKQSGKKNTHLLLLTYFYILPNPTNECLRPFLRSFPQKDTYLSFYLPIYYTYTYFYLPFLHSKQQFAYLPTIYLPIPSFTHPFHCSKNLPTIYLPTYSTYLYLPFHSPPKKTKNTKKNSKKHTKKKRRQRQDPDLGLTYVNAANGLARAQGVRPGALLSNVGGGVFGGEWVDKSWICLICLFFVDCSWCFCFFIVLFVCFWFADFFALFDFS